MKILEEKLVELDVDGRKAKQYGLPERRLINTLTKSGGRLTLKQVSSKSRLSAQELSAAMGSARSSKWIDIIRENDETFLSIGKKAQPTAVERLILRLSKPVKFSDLSGRERKMLALLSKRPGYVSEKKSKRVMIELSREGKAVAKHVQIKNEVEKLTPEMITSGRWKGLNFRPLDVGAPAPVIYSGRKHPVQLFIDEVREIFVSLGFEETDDQIIQSSFWNFDALFTPQDHPAREIQDTFYLSDSRVETPADQTIVSKVASVHENGGETGSRGWGYRWNSELSKGLVMRTHTTPVTIKYLANKVPDNAKVFTIGKVFRNEKVTFKNLVEFHQIEGIAVGKKVTLREMMGLLSKFYERLNLKKIKFWPSFFPYTEPSIQSMVYHERLGKWVELCGMGIFRPEVTIPLGIKNPVLAWGGGLERLVMLRYNIDDVRQLYENNLSWLRRIPLCL